MSIEIHAQDIEMDTLSSLYVDSVFIEGRKNRVLPSKKEMIIADQSILVIPRLQDFLNIVPGVEMQSATLNTHRVNIRGIGSRSPFATSKIRAYLDDILLTDGTGETTMEDLNLGMLDRVTIWRGPSTSIYGAGLGGTILMQTNSKMPEKKINLSTGLNIGNYGLVRSNSDITYKWTDQQYTYINIETINSDGYRANNEFRKQVYTLFHKWTGSNSHFSMFANHINLFGEIPSSLTLDDYRNRPEIAAPIWANVSGFEDYTKSRLGLSYSKQFNPDISWVTTGYTYIFNSYELRPFDVIVNNSKALGLRSRIGELGEGGRWTAGVEAYTELFNFDIFQLVMGQQGPLMESDQSRRWQLNVFGEWTWPISDRLEFQSGVNINTTNIGLASLEASGLDNDLDYKPIISPRMGITWQWNPIWSIHVDVGHGFATPGLDESLLPNGTFNQEIRQEKAWNAELGIVGIQGNNWKVSSTLFYMIVDNILVNRQTDEGFLFAVNAGRSLHYGWEPEFQYSFRSAKDHQFNWTINASIAHYRFVDFVDQGVDFSGNQLTGVAPYKGSANFQYKYKTLSFNILNNYVSSIPVNDANSEFNDAYLLTKMFAGLEWKWAPVNVLFTLSVDNVFNIEYSPMIAVNARAPVIGMPRYYYPGLPRNVMIGVKLSY